MLLLIAGTVAAITLVWAAWVTWGQFEAFAAQRANLPALTWIVLRAVVMLLLMLVFVR
jgi:integrating conjugative element protein (TIGR03758 family)